MSTWFRKIRIFNFLYIYQFYFVVNSTLILNFWCSLKLFFTLHSVTWHIVCTLEIWFIGTNLNADSFFFYYVITSVLDFSSGLLFVWWFSLLKPVYYASSSTKQIGLTIMRLQLYFESHKTCLVFFIHLPSIAYFIDYQDGVMSKFVA